MSHRFKWLSFCVLGVGLLLALLPLGGIQAQEPTQTPQEVEQAQTGQVSSEQAKAKIEALVLSEAKRHAQADFFGNQGRQARGRTLPLLEMLHDRRDGGG